MAVRWFEPQRPDVRSGPDDAACHRCRESADRLSGPELFLDGLTGLLVLLRLLDFLLPDLVTLAHNKLLMSALTEGRAQQRCCARRARCERGRVNIAVRDDAVTHARPLLRSL